ncbi:MAG: hypothetical protein ACLFT6_07935, partial [Bacteroidales bacterium]
MYLKFYLKSRSFIKVPYTDMVHLRQDFNSNDIFGDSPKDCLIPLMDVVTTTDQGIVKAIKNGAIIRWMLKFKNKIRPEDKEMEVKKFV